MDTSRPWLDPSLDQREVHAGMVPFLLPDSDHRFSFILASLQEHLAKDVK